MSGATKVNDGYYQRRWSSSGSSSSAGSKINLEPSTVFCGTPTTSWNSVRWNKPSTGYRSKVSTGKSLFGPQVPYTPTKSSRTLGIGHTPRTSEVNRKTSDSSIGDYTSKLRQGTARFGLFQPRSSSISASTVRSVRENSANRTFDYDSTASGRGSRRGSLSGASGDELSLISKYSSNRQRNSLTGRTINENLQLRSTTSDHLSSGSKVSFMSQRTADLIARSQSRRRNSQDYLSGYNSSGSKSTPFDYRDSRRTSLTRVEPFLTSNYGRNSQRISSAYYQSSTRSGPIYAYKNFTSPASRYGYQKSCSDSVAMNGLQKDDITTSESEPKLSSSSDYDSSSSTPIENEIKKEKPTEKSTKRRKKSKGRTKKRQQALVNSQSSEQKDSSSSDEQKEALDESRNSRKRRQRMKNQLIDEVIVKDPTEKNEVEIEKAIEEQDKTKTVEENGAVHSDSGTLKYQSSDQESKLQSLREIVTKNDKLTVDKEKVESLLNQIQEFVVESTQQLEEPVEIPIETEETITAEICLVPEDEETIEIVKEKVKVSQSKNVKLEKIKKYQSKVKEKNLSKIPIKVNLEKEARETKLVENSAKKELIDVEKQSEKRSENDTPSDAMYEDACEDQIDLIENLKKPETPQESTDMFADLCCQLESENGRTSINLGRKPLSKVQIRLREPPVKKPEISTTVIASIKSRRMNKAKCSISIPIKANNKTKFRLITLVANAKLSAPKEIAWRQESAKTVIHQKVISTAIAELTEPLKEVKKCAKKATQVIVEKYDSQTDQPETTTAVSCQRAETLEQNNGKDAITPVRTQGVSSANPPGVQEEETALPSADLVSLNHSKVDNDPMKKMPALVEPTLNERENDQGSTIVATSASKDIKYVRTQKRRQKLEPKKNISSVDREMLALLTLGEQLSASCTSLKSVPKAVPSLPLRTHSATKLPQISKVVQQKSDQIIGKKPTNDKKLEHPPIIDQQSFIVKPNPPVKVDDPPLADQKPPLSVSKQWRSPPAPSITSIDESIGGGTAKISESPTGSFMTAGSDFHGSLESFGPNRPRLNFFGQAFRASFDNINKINRVNFNNPSTALHINNPLKASGSLPALQRNESTTSANSWYSSNTREEQYPRGALDTATKKINQVLDQARIQHEQKSVKFRQAMAHLDNVYDDIKEEAKRRPLPPKTVLRPKVMYGNFNTSIGNIQRVLPAPPHGMYNRLYSKRSDMSQSYHSDRAQSDRIVIQPQFIKSESPPPPPAPAQTSTKLDFTRRWLEGDLNKWVHEQPKPDLIQSSEYMDVDQRSLGSCSAEVAGIMVKDAHSRREKEAKKIPDIVPQKFHAVIKPSPLRYANVHGQIPTYENYNDIQQPDYAKESARQKVSHFLGKAQMPEFGMVHHDQPPQYKPAMERTKPSAFPPDVMYQSALSDEGYRSYYYKPPPQSRVSKFAQHFESYDHLASKRFNSDEEHRMADSYYSHYHPTHQTDPTQHYYAYSGSAHSVPVSSHWSAKSVPQIPRPPVQYQPVPRFVPMAKPLAHAVYRGPLKPVQQMVPDYETVDEMVAELELNIEDHEQPERPFPTTEVPRDGVDFVTFEEDKVPWNQNPLVYDNFNRPFVEELKNRAPHVSHTDKSVMQPPVVGEIWDPFKTINEEKIAGSIVSSRRDAFEQQSTTSSVRSFGPKLPQLQAKPVMAPIRHKPVQLKPTFDPTQRATDDYYEITPAQSKVVKPDELRSVPISKPAVPSTPPPPRPPEHRFKQFEPFPSNETLRETNDDYDNIPMPANATEQSIQRPLSIEIPGQSEMDRTQSVPKRSTISRIFKKFNKNNNQPKPVSFKDDDSSSGGFKPSRSLLSLKTPSPGINRKGLDTKAASIGGHNQTPSPKIPVTTDSTQNELIVTSESPIQKKSPKGGISSRLKQSLLGVRKKWTS